MNIHPVDHFVFGVLPYLAMALFFIETIRRYRTEMHTFTTESSQFLENKTHFWGSIPFHYGLIGTLTGHVLALFVPKQLLWWNSVPVRLYLLELTAFMFGILMLVGLSILIYRRMTFPRVQRITTTMDWVVYACLAVMAISGLGIALFHGWGTSWFASLVTPYLWSLITFTPDLSAVVTLPHLFKLHFVAAFILIGVFPFTKLVHVLVMPNQYLFRKQQIVRWASERRPKTVDNRHSDKTSLNNV